MMSGSKQYTGLLVQFDTVNANGRVYTKEAFENAVKEYQEKIDNKVALGTLVYPEQVQSIPLDDVSHLVEKIELIDTGAIATVTILDTPKGRELKEMMEREEMVIRTTGMGTIDPITKQVNDYKLIATAFIPKSQDAF